MGNLQSGEQLDRIRVWSWVSFHQDFYSSVYVCFFCIISLGVVFFSRFYTFFFPFGVITNSRVSGIVLVHVCLSIPCPYSISLVGALNELYFSRR